MNIVMIAVHRGSMVDNIIGFRLLDTDTKETVDVTVKNLISAVTEKGVDVENVGIENGKVVHTNGVFSRYPTIVNNKLVGKSPLVILYELADDKYRVANYAGEIVDITEEEAIKYARTEGIANGKVVRGESGVTFISSINGEYKKDKLLEDKKYGSRLKAKRALLNMRDYLIDDNYLAYAENKDIEEVTFNKGLLGVKDRGFLGCEKLHTVTFSRTIERLGIASFMGCSSLKTIKIPEGVKEIPEKCFEGCSSLESVCLPNTLSHIKKSAFQRCHKLKRMYTGPKNIDIEYGAIPRGVKRYRNTEYSDGAIVI